MLNLGSSWFPIIIHTSLFQYSPRLYNFVFNRNLFNSRFGQKSLIWHLSFIMQSYSKWFVILWPTPGSNLESISSIFVQYYLYHMISVCVCSCAFIWWKHGLDVRQSELYLREEIHLGLGGQRCPCSPSEPGEWHSILLTIMDMITQCLFQ